VKILRKKCNAADKMVCRQFILRSMMEALNVEILQYLENNPYSNKHLFCEGSKEHHLRLIQSLEHPIPGYCFQHNERFYNNLCQSQQNLQIKRKHALVVKQFRGESNEAALSQSIITHSFLMVDEKYIVDVAFGENSMRGALPFNHIDEEVSAFGDSYKFEKREDFSSDHLPGGVWWSVYILVHDRWLELWRFSSNIDLSYDQLCHLNYQIYFYHQEVRIRDLLLVIARVTRSQRIILFYQRKTKVAYFRKILSQGEGLKEEIEIRTWSQFEEILQDNFGMTVCSDLKKCVDLIPQSEI
jgi:arylamine N-acetyltransferase